MQEGIEGVGLGSYFSWALQFFTEVSFMPNLKRTSQDQTVEIWPGATVNRGCASALADPDVALAFYPSRFRRTEDLGPRMGG
jgi:hypothetical protein